MLAVSTHDRVNSYGWECGRQASVQGMIRKAYGLWLFLVAIVLSVCMTSAQAQITNPSFTTVSDTVGDGFNIGLALAVAAAVALLVFGYFFKAARRR